MLIAALVTALGAGQAMTAEDVWWTPKLHVSSLSSIAERMQVPFEDKVAVHKGEASAMITNCADYLTYAPQHYEPGSDLELRVLRSWGTDCRALDALKEAVPAKRSFMRGFRLDAKALEYLPPQLSGAVSSEEIRRAEEAGKRGLSWRQYQRNSRTEGEGDHMTVVNGPTRTELEIYARGDFNHDGTEDMLLREDTSITGGTYSDSRLFLLTRSAPNAKLKIVKKYE